MATARQFGAAWLAPHRAARAAIGLTTAILLTMGVSSAAAGAPASWPQFGDGAAHSGVNAQETAIGPSTVGTLKAAFSASLPGVADSPPVYQAGVSTASGTRNLLFVTTKTGWIVALDATTGSTVWSHQNGPGGCMINHGTTPCYTTSSPAIDPSATFVYSYGLDGKVHKYAIGSGTEVVNASWPELATAKPFDEKSSPALTIATVGATTYLYAANGGYPGDRGDYQGHVTAINLNTGAQTVFNTLCSDKTTHFTVTASTDCPQLQSAVWARPSVTYDAATQRIYFATGNAVFDGVHNWGDTVVALHPDGTGTGGGPIDSYTPTNQAQLDSADLDLGSTSPAIVTAPSGSAVANLGVQGGKDAKLRLLDLADLSRQGGPGRLGGELQLVAVPQGGVVLTQPAAWVDPKAGTSWVFVANGNGISALKVVTGAGGTPQLSTGWTHTGSAAAGTSPILANGVLFYLTDGGARALDPTTGQTLWTDTSGAVGLHWQSPIVVNGYLYYADGKGALRAFTLPASAHSASRLAGSDRYATSAAISAATFAPGAPVAYIATGAGFADALSGSAAAGAGKGPMLLVSPTSIPSSIAAELTRLHPGRIVVLGGTAAVSASVATRLATFTAGAVTRIAGANRYETSADIARTVFASGPHPVVYIASGANFPDALSGGALAARDGSSAPLLLVTPTTIPGSIAAELTVLKPASIVVLGGPSAVGDAVRNALSRYAPVTTLSGANRYATSAAIAAGYPVGASPAFIAVGTAYPDGLSAGSAAGSAHAPVLLVTQHSIPGVIAAALTRLQPTSIIVVGGPQAIDAAVQSALGAYVH